MSKGFNVRIFDQIYKQTLYTDLTKSQLVLKINASILLNILDPLVLLRALLSLPAVCISPVTNGVFIAHVSVGAGIFP